MVSPLIAGNAGGPPPGVRCAGLEFQGEGIGKLVPDVVRQLALKGAPKSYQHLKERLERGDWRAAGRAGAMPPANGRAV